jgi:hypothetical protein
MLRLYVYYSTIKILFKLERGPQNETLTHRSFSDKASMKLIVLPADLQKDAGSLFPAKTDEF